MLCNGGCVMTDSDDFNCGGCGIVCTGGRFCAGGSCTCGGNSGFQICNSVCTSTSSDVMNCGGCGQVCSLGFICHSGHCECPDGYTNCNGECFDLQTSPDHCGTCWNQGHSCQPPRQCIQGNCQ
jgi:hypothetical protein